MIGGLWWLLGWYVAGCLVIDAVLAVMIGATPTDPRPDTWIE